MPGSLASEGSQRTALGLYQPTTVPTDASSRATSPVPISNRGSDPQRAISPAPSRATSPAPKPKRRPSVQRQPTTNTSFSQPHMDGLLSRVLDEEDKYTARLREQINGLAQELKVRTEALELAYARVEQADKRTVEINQKYLAEAAARAKAESDSRKMRAENKKALTIVDMWREELDRVKAEVERLEAEKDEAQCEAKKAHAVAKELKRSTKVDRARDNRAPDDRGTDDHKREKEKERERAIAAAVRDAYERGKAEGEASATMKALAAFDKLMDNDELNEWDDDAKQTTRNEIKDLSKKPHPERAKSPEPSPPKSKRSFMRS